MLKKLDSNNPQEIDFTSARDLRVGKDGEIYSVSDSMLDDVELPDGITVKYAFTGDGGQGIVTTGLIPNSLLDTFYTAIAMMTKPTGFKVYRMNGQFTDKAVIYTLNAPAQEINFEGITGGDVLFGESYEPFGIGTRGNVSVTRPATPLAI